LYLVPPVICNHWLPVTNFGIIFTSFGDTTLSVVLGYQ
jgi:hypothetical protein